MLGWFHVIPGPLFPCEHTSSRMLAQASYMQLTFKRASEETARPLRA